MTQVVNAPTHREGHPLDVVMALVDETKIGEVEVNDIALSDHFIISFAVDCTVQGKGKSLCFLGNL